MYMKVISKHTNFYYRYFMLHCLSVCLSYLARVDLPFPENQCDVTRLMTEKHKDLGDIFLTFLKDRPFRPQLHLS